MRPAIEAERADESRTLAARVASSTRRCTSLLRCARTCQKGKEKRKKNIVSFEHATLHLFAPLRPRRTRRETEKKRRAKEKQGRTKKKRKKEKKGRQECYAMQMTPKEVLMDQWHGTQRYSSISYKTNYIVAKRRNIKYLRRKGRFAIN